MLWESEHPWGLSDPRDGVGSNTLFLPIFCNGHSLKGAGGEQERSYEEHLCLQKPKGLEVPEMGQTAGVWHRRGGDHVWVQDTVSVSPSGRQEVAVWESCGSATSPACVLFGYF